MPAKTFNRSDDMKAATRAFRAFVRVRRGEERAGDRAALEAAGIDPRRPGDVFAFRLPPRPAEARAAMSVQLGAAGGYLRTPGVVASFEAALAFASAVRQTASIARTETGDSYRIATSDDTGVEGEVLAENAAPTETPPALGQVVLYDRKFSSKMLAVPYELFEDGGELAVNSLGRLMGDRIGRVQNRVFTAALAAQATAGRTAASATAVGYADLIELVGAVDPAYRENGTFMTHADVLLHLRKVVDGAGRPVLMDGEGRAPRLLGYPVVCNLHMDSAIASGAKSVFFGDFGRFVIRDVREVRVRHLVERYRDTDREGFIAYLRSDGALIDAGTHPVQYIQH